MDDAIGVYEQLLKHDPDSAPAANNLAMLLVTYKSDSASLDRARKLTEAFAKSNNASLVDTWGWVQFKRAEYPAALATLQVAVDKEPNNATMRYHLAMAQLKGGSREEARTNLEKALKGGENFADARDAKAQLASLQKH